MNLCARCNHDLNSHGAGCTIGWFGAGGSTDPCHCPNDDDGNVAETCAYIACGGIAVRVDRIGQFYCKNHPEGVPIDEITTWT